MAVKRTGRPVGRPPRVPISPTEVQTRQAKINEQRAYIESVKSGGKIGDSQYLEGDKKDIDVNALEKQLEREENALKYLAPQEGTTSEKRQAQKDYDEAAEYIKKNALSMSEVEAYPNPKDIEKDHKYGKAVEKSMAQEVGNPKFTEMCNQMKRAASILDPDDPSLRDVNRHRAS